MHPRALLSSPSDVGVWNRLVGPLIGFLVLVLTAGPHGSALGQDEFPGAPAERDVNLRVYPLDVWSPRVGLGMGAGLVVHHAGRRNALGLLTLGPARHEQVASAVWASGNPNRAARYVLVNARGVHTNRDWFYGLGPFSSERARRDIERSSVDVRVRASQRFADDRLLIQPKIAVTTDRVDRVPNVSQSDLDPQSRTHLRQLASGDVGLLNPTQTGLRIGLALNYATRSSGASQPSLRIHSRWSRYVGLTSSFLHFDVIDLGLYPTVPIVGKHRLLGRLSLSVTNNRGRAEVPYYMRPTLEAALVPGWSRSRFVANDRLITSMLYRFPLGEPLNVVTIEGHVGVHAASVYDDIGSQAAFAVDFDDRLTNDPGRVPLRPSASAGLHLGLSFRQAPSLDLAVGVSPEGVTAARITLQKKINALRLAPHHALGRH